MSNVANPPVPSLVLYVPALNEIAGSPAIDEAAQRIARTLDHHVEPIPETYSVRAAAPEPYGSGNAKAEVREILRHPANGDPVVTHRVYHLDYHGALDDPAASATIGHQVWSTFLQFVRLLLRFVRFVIRADALTAPQKTSLMVGGFCLGLTMVYVVLALAGLAYFILSASGDDAVPGSMADLVRPVYDGLHAIYGERVVRVLAVLSLLGLTVEKFRAKLETAVQTYLRFGRYIESPAARAVCLGRFNDLLEHILSQPAVRVDIISYSMGSLVSLDALFPIDGEPARRALHVRTLTTIGCPFDLVRTFWPDYFANRAVPASRMTWLNVYSPVDVLGSNFANEGGVVSDWSAGINATAIRRSDQAGAPPADAFLPAQNLYYDPAGRKNLSWIDALLFHAFEAHSQYWVAGKPDAESCFKRFVPAVFAA